MSALSDLIGVLVPGGLAAASVLIINAVKSWRVGSQSRQETVLQRWQRLAQEAEDRTNEAEQNEDYACRVADHWRQRSADLEYLMRQAGLPIPARLPLPKQQRSTSAASTRRSRTIKKLKDEDDEDD